MQHRVGVRTAPEPARPLSAWSAAGSCKAGPPEPLGPAARLPFPSSLALPRPHLGLHRCIPNTLSITFFFVSHRPAPDWKASGQQGFQGPGRSPGSDPARDSGGLQPTKPGRVIPSDPQAPCGRERQAVHLTHHSCCWVCLCLGPLLSCTRTWYN